MLTAAQMLSPGGGLNLQRFKMALRDVCSGGDGAAAAGGAGGGSCSAGRPGAGEEGPGAGAEDRSERVRAHPGGGAERLGPAQVTRPERHFVFRPS